MDNTIKSSDSGESNAIDSEVCAFSETTSQRVNSLAITGVFLASMMIFALSVGLIGPSLTTIFYGI